LQGHLEASVITGITTNTGYLARLCGLASFVSGGVHTGLLEEEAATLLKMPAETPRLAGLAAIGVQIARESQAALTSKPFNTPDGWRLNGAPSLNVRFGLEGGPLHAALQSDETQLSARVDGDHAVVARRAIQSIKTAAGWTIKIGNTSKHAGNKAHETAVNILVDEAGAIVAEAGEVWQYPFIVSDASADGLDAVDELKATLPGKIAALTCVVGQSVKKGEVLVVLEAMKMEHSLGASRDGVVGEVMVSPGRQVRAGEVLVRLLPQEAAS
jgi:3-methylcrotonyl-CoA carboxylase alpha subunit